MLTFLYAMDPFESLMKSMDTFVGKHFSMYKRQHIRLQRNPIVLDRTLSWWRPQVKNTWRWSSTRKQGGDMISFSFQKENFYFFSTAGWQVGGGVGGWPLEAHDTRIWRNSLAAVRVTQVRRSWWKWDGGYYYLLHGTSKAALCNAQNLH